MKKFLKRILIAAAVGATFYVLMNLVSGAANQIFDGRFSPDAPIYTLPMPYILYAAVILALAAWYVAVGTLTLGCSIGYIMYAYTNSLPEYKYVMNMTALVVGFISIFAAILVQLIYNFIRKKIDENRPA